MARRLVVQEAVSAWDSGSFHHLIVYHPSRVGRGDVLQDSGAEIGQSRSGEGSPQLNAEFGDHDIADYGQGVVGRVMDFDFGVTFIDPAFIFDLIVNWHFK